AMTDAGKALAEYTLMGITNTDWEDLAVGPGPSDGSFIYVADIGDNAARTGGTARTEIQVLRVAEPDISTTQALAQKTLSGVEVLRFTYPDKAHDAEALMVDPVSHDLLIATKESDGTTVIFRAPGDTPVDTPTKLEKVTSVQVGASGMDTQVSAGDASPSGDRFALRTYGNVLMWPRAATFVATFSAMPKTLPGDDGPQSEGLTFSADGTSLISSGERARTIYESKSACK
ncbi:MAG TPA: hypothetical protein VFQ61_21370, partial [Polyangiaceae bacterium]|nr:hypothetical protein [Polyangiaceae bacterium]